VEQAVLRINTQENNDDTAKASTGVSSTRTQDKSYLTVLQSNGTPKDTQVQSPSSAVTDATSPKWKQTPVNTVPSVPTTTAKLDMKYLYNVKFKRATEVFALDNQSVELKPGSFVKVEADRGHDMGMVVSRMPFSEYDAESRPTNASERFDKNMLEKSKNQSECTPTLKKILRVATSEEITMLDVKRKDEDDILNQCKTKAKQRGLIMNVIDAEYQFDRNKLTFFFQAQGRVDFRGMYDGTAK
jgi:cell fate regulator YaaT (PSP1 superfamily)